MPNYNSQLQSNNTNLQQVLQTLQTKAAGGGTQATPVISVNSSTGLITATAGTKTSTHQLAFQAAQTITPSTANKTIASGRYLTGAQTIKGDINLVAENIKSGVSIFGVNGTLVEGGGMSSGEQVEWSTNEDDMVTGTLTSYTNDRMTSIGSAAFRYCPSLTTVSFPACTTIGSDAFYSCPSLTTVSFPACKTIGSAAFQFCSSLTTVSFPACTTIGGVAFQFCSSLTTVSFPACTTIGGEAFYSCPSLTTVSFPACKTIGSYAFRRCYNLASIILGAASICKLSNSNAFSSTPYAGYSASFSGTPYIYVPSSLVTSYKTATNWTYYSSYFKAIESLGENIITFTIVTDIESTYQAEEGMTFGEWVNSEYNTDGWKIVNNAIFDSSGVFCLGDQSYVIVDGRSYLSE